jgi:hypothetical protein
MESQSALFRTDLEMMRLALLLDFHHSLRRMLTTITTFSWTTLHLLPISSRLILNRINSSAYGLAPQ